MIEQILIPTGLAFFSSLITWLFARKKNVQELESMKLDNEIKSAKYYQDLLDDMSRRLDKAIDELMLSEERHRVLMNINRELVDELQKFKQLNGKR
jgi:uncharacterized membrane protein YheB (UPF0754 family)